MSVRTPGRQLGEESELKSKDVGIESRGKEKKMGPGA